MDRYSSQYAFDNGLDQERARLSSLESLLDIGTIYHLEQLGISEASMCLEVGAGGGSIASWMCGQVGQSGKVVAYDLQTAMLKELKWANLEIIEEDILSGQLPKNTFDIVHTRWLLHWLTRRKQAIAELVQCLRPGGWLLAEEPDCITTSLSLPKSFGRVVTSAFAELEALGGGMDTRYGRELYADVREAGLVNVAAQGRVGMIHGGDSRSGSTWLRMSLEMAKKQVLEANSVTAAEFDRTLEMLDDPRFSVPSPVTMAVWGRRPG